MSSNCDIKAWKVFERVVAPVRAFLPVLSNTCVYDRDTTCILVSMFQKNNLEHVCILYTMDLKLPRLILAFHQAFGGVAPREKTSPASPVDPVDITTSERIRHSLTDFEVLNTLGTTTYPLLSQLPLQRILPRRNRHIRSRSISASS